MTRETRELMIKLRALETNGFCWILRDILDATAHSHVDEHRCQKIMQQLRCRYKRELEVASETISRYKQGELGL